jgi:hypothetical protein
MSIFSDEFSQTTQDSVDSTGKISKPRLGQTITTTGAIDVANVVLKVQTVASPTDALLVKIYASNKTTLLGTSRSVDSSLMSGSLTDFSFTFNSAVSLSATTEYFIVVERTGSLDNTNYYSVGTNTAGGYAGGSRWTQNDLLAWSSVSGEDHYFKVQSLDANKVFLTDAGGSGDELLPIGYATAGGSNNDSVAFATSGVATVDITGTAIQNDTMYLSNTAGQVQNSAGATSVKVGRMISPTKMLIIMPPL